MSFELKNFSIVQEHSPMKVGTDGILLPAWISEIKRNLKTTPLRILDIGAGTGIISLMLAEAFPKAEVIALEINEDALLDARTNIDNSPYAKRITLLKQDFLTYKTDKAFNLIVSNPPYFSSNGATSPNGGRALARQEDSTGLTLYKLMERAKGMLSDRGEASLFLITPFDRENDLRLYACELLLRPKALCRVSSRPNKAVRLLSQWTKLNLTAHYTQTKLTNLTLHNEEGRRSSNYLALLRPFLP